LAKMRRATIRPPEKGTVDAHRIMPTRKSLVPKRKERRLRGGKNATTPLREKVPGPYRTGGKGQHPGARRGLTKRALKKKKKACTTGESLRGGGTKSWGTFFKGVLRWLRPRMLGWQRRLPKKVTGEPRRTRGVHVETATLTGQTGGKSRGGRRTAFSHDRPGTFTGIPGLGRKPWERGRGGPVPRCTARGKKARAGQKGATQKKDPPREKKD